MCEVYSVLGIYILTLLSHPLPVPNRLWDLRAGQLLQTMEGHSDRVTAIALTADGEKALSGSSDGSINVWSTNMHSR